MRALNRFAALSRVRRTAADRQRVARAAARLRALPPPALKVSGRLGMVDGHPTRTFFFRVEPARKGGALTRYTHRVDGHRAEELESRGGLPADDFEARAVAREQTVRRGRAAVYGLVIELPFEADADTRAAIMERIAERYADWGVTWAVHGRNARLEDQPHGHLLILAGPAGERPVEGSEAMKALRHYVASAVNAVHRERTGRRLPREWHGGTLADTGIARPPRPDIPLGLYRARQRRDELLRAGKPVPVRTGELAAAADRIDAAHDRAVAEGRTPEPQGLARRRWRTAQREALATAIAEHQRDAQEREEQRAAAERAVALLERQRAEAVEALRASRRDLLNMRGIMEDLVRERDAARAEIRALRDVTRDRHTASEPGASPPAAAAVISTGQAAAADRETGAPTAAARPPVPGPVEAAEGPPPARPQDPAAVPLYTQADLDVRIAQAVVAAVREAVVDRRPAALDAPRPYATAPILRSVTVPGGLLTREREITVDTTGAFNAGVKAGWEAVERQVTAEWASVQALTDQLGRADRQLRQLIERWTARDAEHREAVERARREGETEGFRRGQQKGREEAVGGAVVLAKTHRQAVTALEAQVVALTGERDQARSELKALRNAPADRPEQADPPAGHGSGTAQDRAGPAPGRDHGAALGGSGIAPDTAAAGPGGPPDPMRSLNEEQRRMLKALFEPDESVDGGVLPPAAPVAPAPSNAGTPHAASPVGRGAATAPPPVGRGTGPTAPAPAQPAGKRVNEPLWLDPRAGSDTIQEMKLRVSGMTDAALDHQVRVQFAAELRIRLSPQTTNTPTYIERLRAAVGVLRAEIARRGIPDPTPGLEKTLRERLAPRNDRSPGRD